MPTTIASEISRLQQAKADLKTAIEGKGITVSSAATIDAYADYVDDIEEAAPAVTHPNPTISVSSGGLITATHTQGAGTVAAGTTTATEQLSTQGAQTITPGTTNQTISSGKYLTGTQTIAGDADLVASNIKSGVTIFNVTGSYSGGGGSTLTPTAGDYPVVGNGGLGGGGSNLTSTGISITIPVSGTYRLKWCAFRRNNSTSYSWSSQLYRKRGNSTSAIGTEVTTWTSTYTQANSLDIACEANDIIYVYVRGRSSSYSWGGMLTACVNQKLWTN